MLATTATPSTNPASDELAQLTSLQRIRRAGVALGKVLSDPNDTGQVLEFLGVINSGKSTRKRVARFFATPAGKKLFDERRTIDSHSIDLDALAALPEGTLGHAYAAFLRSHGLTPEIFDGPPAGISDPQRSYLIQRMRQTHDLWHVVTGCETDPAGEVALQAFTYAQSRAPGSALLAFSGMLRTLRHNPGVVRDVLALYRAGTRARQLPSFAWEDHWAKPLSEVRAMLGLPVEPLRRRAAA